MLDVVVRYLHFFSIFGLAGALLIENMAIAAKMDQEDAQNLPKVDAVYRICLVLAFSFGFMLWLWVGKPSEFYTENPLFQSKLGLFVLLALLSIYPTLFFNKHRDSEVESIRVPAMVRILLKVELLALLIMFVLANMMTRGIGL
jgi:putative membrane protein